MTPSTPARMVVVKKEEKELRLRQLIINGLARLAQMGGGPLALRLVAQSAASPVARAVVQLKAEIAAAGIEAHAILTRVDQGLLPVIGASCSYRQLGDIRCHDAHELLILGPDTVWIGDCMRRDPAVRDSYELHADGCTETVRTASMSFDKLWQLASPLDAPEDAAALALAAGLAVLPSGDANAPTALTRH